MVVAELFGGGGSSNPHVFCIVRGNPVYRCVLVMEELSSAVFADESSRVYISIYVHYVVDIPFVNIFSYNSLFLRSFLYVLQVKNLSSAEYYMYV